MSVKPLSVFKPLLISLALFSAVAANAADEFDMYVSDVAILQIKEIQTELKITEGQRVAMNNHAEWLNRKGGAINKEVADNRLTTAGANRQMASHLANLKKKVLGELTDKQIVRLREITLQRDGLLPLMDQKVSEKIGMTAAQLKLIRDTYVANDQKAKQVQQRALAPIFEKYGKMKPKNNAEKKQLEAQANKEIEAEQKRLAPQLAKLGKEFEDFVKRILTKGQRDSFAKLKGKPFTPPKKAGG